MVPYHNRRFRSILCSFIRSRQSRFSTAFRLTPTLVLQGSRAVVTRSAHFPRGGHLWTMDDVILVRCGRDVQLKSFISLVEEDGGTFSEGRCELKGESNSKSELNTTGYETEPTELWMLADNGQLLKVADINRVMQIDELKITKESR